MSRYHWFDGDGMIQVLTFIFNNNNPRNATLNQIKRW